MKAFSLLKFRTVVAQTLFTSALFTLAIVAFSDLTLAQTSIGCATAECEANRRCDALVDELSSAAGMAQGFCGNGGNCGVKLKQCSAAATNLGRFDVISPTADDCKEAIGSANCGSLVDKTKSTSGPADYERDQRLSEQERKDAKKELAELKKQQADQQKANTDEQATLAEENDKLDKQYRDDKQAAEQALKDTISSLDEQKVKAYYDAQQKYDELDLEYIQMRDAARRVADDFANLQTRRLTECRSEADGRFQKAEAEQKQRIAAENAVLKNQGLRGLAGYYNRQKRKRNQASKINYSGYFRDCMDGITPTGAAALEAIDNLQKKKLSDEKNLADRATRLEKLRAQTIERLNQVVKMAEEGKQKATQESQLKISNIERDYQIAKQRLQQRQMMAYQNQAQQNKAMQEQIEAAGEELSKASSSVQVSQSRHICAQQQLGGVPDPSLIDSFKSKLYAAKLKCSAGIACGSDSVSAITQACTTLRTTVAEIESADGGSARGVASPASSSRSAPVSSGSRPPAVTAPAAR